MASDIQKLREVTGAGVMECKRAFKDADGDFNKAVKIIHERGLIKAEKKSERATGAGLIESYIHNGRVGVLLEVRAETDFAVHSEPFKTLAHELVMQIAAMNPRTVDELISQSYIKDDKLNVDQLIKNTIAKVGENIKVERFCRYEI